MPKLYIVGLFERGEVNGQSPVGYACIWAIIDGPIENRQWADALNAGVTGEVTIRYQGSRWKCVYSIVVPHFDLNQYGLQRGDHAAPQMVMPELVGRE